MKKQGFTLIELLAVIIILSSLVMLFVPAIGNVISNSKTTIGKSQINDILTAAYNWSLKNIDDLPDPGGKKYITLAHLKQAGLIDYDITNPDTKELYDDALVISITNDADYIINSNNEKKEGNYVYKIENDNVNTITDTPYSFSSQVDCLDSQYSLDIELDDIEEPYSINEIFTPFPGIEVISLINYEDAPVTEIKTNSIGMYEVIYTLLNINGQSKSINLKVLIKDSTAPTITIGSDVTISTSISSYDFNSGVTCDDISGYCRVNCTSDVQFGTPGIYTITCVASDSSGISSTATKAISVVE